MRNSDHGGCHRLISPHEMQPFGHTNEMMPYGWHRTGCGNNLGIGQELCQRMLWVSSLLMGAG